MSKNKNIATIFFTILFLIILVTPTVVITLDNTVDVSCLYSMSEEEEETEAKDFKLTFKFEAVCVEPQSSYLITPNTFGYTFKAYSKPNLNLVFPPPDFA